MDCKPNVKFLKIFSMQLWLGLPRCIVHIRAWSIFFQAWLKAPDSPDMMNVLGVAISVGRLCQKFVLSCWQKSAGDYSVVCARTLACVAVSRAVMN